MAGNGAGAADHAPAADCYAAGHHCGPGNGSMLSYPDIMTYLHLVIDFHTSLYCGVLNSAPVNRRVGAYFNVIPDDHIAELRNFQPATGVIGDAITIRPDNGTRMNQYPFTDFNPLHKAYA